MLRSEEFLILRKSKPKKLLEYAQHKEEHLQLQKELAHYQEIPSPEAFKQELCHQ